MTLCPHNYYPTNNSINLILGSMNPLIDGTGVAGEAASASEESVANDTEEEVVYQKKPKRKRCVAVVQDSNSLSNWSNWFLRSL